MRATSDLASRPAAGAAMATLMAVAARTAWTVRYIALGYIVIQVVIWPSFYTARPERLAGPAVAVLWAAVVAVRLRWSRPASRPSRPGSGWSPPGWRLAVLDTAVVAALALGAWWCVPPAMQGDTSSWLYIAVVSQVIVPAWFARLAVFAPLALVSVTAFWAGAAMAAPASPGATSPAAAAANVIAIVAVARCALWLLGRRARSADAALARADAESRAEYVELSLSTERREHERLLHDTVLNTLTALGRGAGAVPLEVLGGAGGADDLDQVAAAARCQHDVTLIEHALGAVGDAAGPAGGLLIAIEAVVIEMRARGLIVHVNAGQETSPADGTVQAGAGVRAAAGVRPDAPDPVGPDLEVPDPVAMALAHAVREALANVARHAGTAEAWVEVRPIASLGSDRAGTGPGGPERNGPERNGVEIIVRDHGAGFDPAGVDLARLGVRRSIVERVADWGGQAAVRSAPGEGTLVTLRWLAPVESAPAAGPSGGRRAAPTDAYDFNIPKVVGAVAVVWQFALLTQVIAYLHDYRQPAVVVAVWLGLLAAGAWLIPRTRAGGLSAGEAVAAIAVAVAAVALVGWERRLHGAGGPVDWSVVGSGWLLALVAISRPPRAWVCGAALVFAAHAVFAIRILGVTSLDLARLVATAYSLVIILAVFAAVRPATAAYARLAARRAALVSQAAAERAAVAAVRADQRERLALLEAEALPLLRGIADGTLAVTDGAVRRRCASYAATLRRALVDRAGDAGGLLAELAPVLNSARDRGTPTEFQLVGDPGSPSRAVAGATAAAVDGMLRALPPHPVTLTVLADADDVELFVTFDQPPGEVPGLARLSQSVPAAAGWHAAVEVSDTGAGCLEVRWRNQVAA